jgi:uncharacterized protein YkwD
VFPFLRVRTFIVLLAVTACGGAAAPRAAVTPAPVESPGAVEVVEPPLPTPERTPARPSPAPTTRPAGPAAVPVPTISPHLVDGVLIGSRQQELTNQARAAAGLKPLGWDPCLAGVAARHAAEMASAGRIFHGQGVDQDLACALGTHRAGENVGETSGGADDQRIFTAFMNSSGHRANILGQYRFMATAWVVVGRTGYISVEFG